MPLPTFATLDEVPEAVRDGYIEKGGKWVPDNSADRTLLAEKKAAADELAKLRAALGDKKPEDIASLLKAQQDAEEERQRKAGEHDKILEKRLAERDADWTKKVDALSPYKTMYEDGKLNDAIRKGALAAGVDPKDLEEYVIPLVKARGRVKMDGEKIVVYDKDGDPTGMTVDKFFAEPFKAEAPKFYQAAGGSGGGATGGSGGAGGSKIAGGAVKVTDAAGFLANVDKIAKGEVKVAQ